MKSVVMWFFCSVTKVLYRAVGTMMPHVAFCVCLAFRVTSLYRDKTVILRAHVERRKNPSTSTEEFKQT